jgi:hypothetical protein
MLTAWMQRYASWQGAISSRGRRWNQMTISWHTRKAGVGSVLHYARETMLSEVTGYGKLH